jgi:hypothetical protein
VAEIDEQILKDIAASSRMRHVTFGGRNPLVHEDAQIVAKNIVTNARLFCLMVFALDLAGLGVFRGSLWALCAFVAAMPVAISVLVDQMPAGRMRWLSTWAGYSIAALAAIGTLLCILGA